MAIEEVAGVDVLCSDKTGTLTQNKLTLGDPFVLDKVTAEQVVVAAALASRADDNDTIDLAVLGGLADEKALDAYNVVHFEPFDPVHKRTEATVVGALVCRTGRSQVRRSGAGWGHLDPCHQSVGPSRARGRRRGAGGARQGPTGAPRRVTTRPG